MQRTIYRHGSTIYYDSRTLALTPLGAGFGITWPQETTSMFALADSATNIKTGNQLDQSLALTDIQLRPEVGPLSIVAQLAAGIAMPVPMGSGVAAAVETIPADAYSWGQEVKQRLLDAVLMHSTFRLEIQQTEMLRAPAFALVAPVNTASEYGPYKSEEGGLILPEPITIKQGITFSARLQHDRPAIEAAVQNTLQSIAAQNPWLAAAPAAWATMYDYITLSATIYLHMLWRGPSSAPAR